MDAEKGGMTEDVIQFILTEELTLDTLKIRVLSNSLHLFRTLGLVSYV